MRLLLAAILEVVVVVVVVVVAAAAAAIIIVIVVSFVFACRVGCRLKHTFVQDKLPFQPACLQASRVALISGEIPRSLNGTWAHGHA